ncbi:MAG: EcsC family protein [Pedosphaera sp.]|nr:EcsC family protein [Pedosphaera sp.]
MSAEDLAAIHRAKLLLENPGFAAKLASHIGAPLERGFTRLPKNWTTAIQKASHAALWRALSVAVRSMSKKPRDEHSDMTHKVMVGATGWIGGAFGLAALAIELPVSTTIMLRSIADIARDEGHDIDNMSIRLSCLEVFALGGPGKSDDASENGYWIVRAALSKAISEAAAYVTERGILEKTAPAMVHLVATIASRFGVVISEQAAAKAIPIIGAVAGSTINVLFMDHFQNMARGHFIVKRLESKYGSQTVMETYKTLAVPVKRLPESTQRVE